MTGARHEGPPSLRVVLFSGGRGSGALARLLAGNPAVDLTVAINGYDDGLSTGEVRRFLGDALGPSDFRKNASRLARVRRSCPEAVADLVEIRLPVGCSADAATRLFDVVAGRAAPGDDDAARAIGRLASVSEDAARLALSSRLDRFAAEIATSGRPFDYSDCSLGNLVFAGAFLRCGRRFNDALDDYCSLLGLPAGLVENVTDGTNAFLVAIDPDGRLLGSEAEIVDAKRRNRISEIFLIDRPLEPGDRTRLEALPRADLVAAFGRLAQPVRLNPRIVPRLAEAQLIIFAPGTQHSSLFPSYLTPGLSAAIAANTRALKVLITNIETDAEIAGSSAVDIIERAVYYLEEQGRLSIPTPCLITHYLINDPSRAEAGERPYIPLGRLDSLEDPRLVRVGNFEDGVTGRHDAARVLGPFLESFLARERARRVAVWLHGSVSGTKISQTLLEFVRAGMADLPLDVTVFHGAREPLDAALLSRLPFGVTPVAASDPAPAVRAALVDGRFDYIALFESSGMYLGEDLVELLRLLPPGRLDAVWGSRRLSVRDIAESLAVRYRQRPWLRFASQVGSHVLSLAYLAGYGRYVSDTLSGARVVRARYALDASVDPDDRLANQRLLSTLLRDRAEFLEIPVRFFALSPERVRRTSVFEGLRSLAAITWWRLRPRPVPRPGGPA